MLRVPNIVKSKLEEVISVMTKKLKKIFFCLEHVTEIKDMPSQMPENRQNISNNGKYPKRNITILNIWIV